MLHSCLLCETIQLAIDDRVLILNSAADPFVSVAAEHIRTGSVVLAEDNIVSLRAAQSVFSRRGTITSQRHVPFHEYILHEKPATMDVAVMNLLYQPSKAWMNYGLQLAAYALKPRGRLYVEGAKDRGILSMARSMQVIFGNVETLVMGKGQRVVCSHKGEHVSTDMYNEAAFTSPFAEGKLDEGTRLLLEALEIRVTDVALDIGCGAGFIGLHIARIADKGQVTMVDASLAAVDAARRRVQESGLNNVQVLPSDGIEAVQSQLFDLAVTNPPFHLGGIRTTETAERFIREASQVLRPRGRFYLVANRFLKYEPTIRACFKTVEEVGGDTRYKVLRGLK